MMKKKPRLLALGQAKKPTGYARVFNEILSRLSDSFEICHFGINYKGESTCEDGYLVEPNLLPGDIFAKDQLPNLLEQFTPDILLMCHDPGFYSIHQHAIKSSRKPPFVVFYCPIDWDASPTEDPHCIKALSEVDLLVLYNDFGLQVVEIALSYFRKEGLICSLPERNIIFHGVDKKKFFPLSGNSDRRKYARSLLFPDRPELEDAFIVLNGNRNTPRKRMDLTLSAFANFTKNKPDSWLVLNLGETRAENQIRKMAEEFGIHEKLLSFPCQSQVMLQSDEKLNLLYNACDVGVNTSTGEGWGLVSFEHAATGAAQIVPNHTSCRLLWENVAMLIQLESGSSGIISTEHLSHLLETLYLNRNQLNTLSEKAYKFATSSQFNWDNIANKWRHKLLSLTE